MSEFQDAVKYLIDNLSLETVNKDVYNGGVEKGSMYDRCITIQLKLGDIVISEADIEVEL